MKLTLMVAIGMLSFLSPAYAENWQFIADAPDGGRALIDVDSIVKITHKKDIVIIQSTIRVVGAPNTEPDWKADIAIDYDSCMKSKNGKMIFFPHSAKTPDIFFWDATANRIYDNVGAYMCGFIWGEEHPGEKLPEATPQDSTPQTQREEKSL